MCNYPKKYELKNKMQLLVRGPEKNDAQDLINMMKKVDCETRFLAREPGEFNITLEQEVDFIESSNNDCNRQFLIAEVDGKIVANCAVAIHSTGLRYRHRAIAAVAVLKKYWRLGIGKILMEECIAWCENNNIEQVELEVIKDNDAARELYERLGFKVFGTEPNSIKYGDGTYVDQYFMCKYLNK